MTASVTARPGQVAWLVLVYRLPAGSGLKAVIRRKLTALAAVYPVNAVAVLPSSPTAERAFRRLRNMIGESGGSAQVLCAEAIEGEGRYRRPVPGGGHQVAGGQAHLPEHQQRGVDDGLLGCGRVPGQVRGCHGCPPGACGNAPWARMARSTTANE